MSLRARLIVAFFVLSVLPLTAVTAFSYRNNVQALRLAAEREADVLAGELGQRMQLVTAQLSERVEHLMDLSVLEAEMTEITQAAATRAAAPAVVAATPPAAAAPALSTLAPGSFDARVADALGEAAVLLNNVELRGLRSGGRGRPPGGGDAGARPSPPAGARGDASNPPRLTRGGGQGGERLPIGAGRETGSGDAGAGRPLPDPVAAAVEATDRLRIDMAPIRRDLLRQMVPDGQVENLTPEERARLGRELNARMLGIAEGIRLSAAELQKRAEEAKAQESTRGQETAAAAAAAGVPAPPAPPGPPPPAPVPSVNPTPVAPAPKATPALPPLTRRTALAGNKLGVTFERNGEVVRQVDAEINLPNVLATVFSTTRRDRGELPFAVGKDGHIYARSDEDRITVQAFGAVATAGGPETARPGNWIVVTTTDPSGTGLKLGIARPVGDSLNALRLTAARNAGLGLGLIAIALVGIVPLSTRLTRNVTSLADGVKRIAAGDYSARVPVRTQDEVGQLAVAFNNMAGEVERHQRSAVEQERIRRELELGRRIQNEMLPHGPLRLGLMEAKGVSVPAREVGGDFFNYFELPDHRVALLVGDVSGKGVGAALLMANIQASLRTRLALGQDLAAIANAIDADVEASSPGPVYATLFVGILDPVTRRLQYVNAGHHPQYVVRPTGQLERMSSTGLPVGLLAGKGYQAGDVQLRTGDLIFFYTDGCVEAESEMDEFFGAERLEAVLLRRDEGGIDGLLQRVEREVTAFRGARELFDDATMMAVTVG